MGTRAAIFTVTDKGYTGIYLHYDGYPSYAGEILYNYYNTSDKVEKLIALGDLSTIAPEVGEKLDFDDYEARETQCCAYHRDRGEEFRQYKSDYLNPLEYINDGIEYVYLYNGDWLVFNGRGQVWNNLKDVIRED